MNRKIKFRAWYIPREEMVQPDRIESINFEVKTLGVYMPIENKGYHKLRLSDFILMQYTGLTEPDGREIYEGDLYKIEGNWPVYEVVYNEKYGCFGLGGKHPFYDFKTIEERQYVIQYLGNRHEHPELLEG